MYDEKKINSNQIELFALPTFDKERLDQFLYKTIKEESRNYYSKLIKEGFVKVNNKSVKKPSFTVRPYDKVTLLLKPKKTMSIEHDKLNIKILYEDYYIIIINKERNMVVHPGAGNFRNTILNALINSIHKDEFTDQERPGIVHRLDKETTGVLIIAKSEKIMRQLSEQFKNRQVKKTYLALVHGDLNYKEGFISMPIKRSKIHRQKMEVDLSGKVAFTEYSIIGKGTFENQTVSLLKVNIYTGRTHQIRVHMSYIGHPIVGDKKYSTKSFKNCPEIALHALKIEFLHPVTKEVVSFQAPLPEDLQNFIKKCNINYDLDL
ncbi:ribosomal large subunit pseudouridine synthase D [Thermodesulfobium acidiphilum]|uniref:Pseudouridine synthase n=1 Tax=Thermodesulfobium acidiphilum TaxID=1794699 RepID=A0A2R4VZX9_THEAF|nr:RluA family pseudouridine synthase [Thermodesulfobium acidiphilum]AWB10111.1 ribosomal large subunit pseudouridine synthase D [Thermodesulfobium acidiphilum]